MREQGCTCDDWTLVEIENESVLPHITNVRFSGPVRIHEGVELHNIHGGLGGCEIEDGARIINVASLEFEGDSDFGVGEVVSVLDETGSRALPIYPGLSSQVATLLSREPKWLHDHKGELEEFIDSRKTSAVIGRGALIRNCGKIKNVSVGPEIRIEGSLRLENGSLINNAEPGKCFTYVGHGVDAANFILEDGKIDSKAIVSHCYVGQGAVLSNGFSAHDSLFFANCSMENGEVHSILSGPYTVSMHKGTLLIGCQTSFMNAGSGTNQSNHMYKLGPVHWGLLERGVKTSSSSYLMMGAKIGAFSLLMGAHKTHPDSSQFPFSYLFGDDRGNTTVVPGIMLRSCGLLRDEMKWPNRDRRLKPKLPLYDHITFHVLNPFTVDTLLNTIELIDDLLMRPADDGLYMRYKGMRFTRAALERAKSLYTIAVFKYLSVTLENNEFPEPTGQDYDQWVDVGGQILPRRYLERAKASDSIPQMEAIFSEAYINYDELERQWIADRFGESWRSRASEIGTYARRFDELIAEDRDEYMQMLARESDMLQL